MVIWASPALAIEEGGIGGKPAHPRADNARSESIFVYELKPGDSVKDEVQVVNNTNSEKTLLLYAVDSQVASGGAFSCAQKVDEPLSVGRWINVNKSEVHLAPNSFENVPFTINVPITASVGESNGCIVVQDSQRSAVSENGGITLSFRTAIRVAVTIPGKIEKSLVFTNTTAKIAENQKLRLTTALKNSGNVSLDTEVSVKLQNLLGVPVNTAGGSFPVLAGSEATFNFEVDDPFWGGWYFAIPEATYNSNADSSLSEKDSSNKNIQGQGVTIFIWPKPLAFVIEATVLIGSIVLITGLILRNRKIKQLHNKSRPYTVKQGDSLHSIAKEFNVSWRNIQKVNKLRAPYHLEPGQRIKLPHR